MTADPGERKRQYRRAAFEGRIRLLLLRLVWIFRVVAVLLGVGMLVQTWKLVTGHLPPDEAAVRRFQTRNGFIADGVFVALLLFLLRALLADSFGVFSPPMNPADRSIFVALGGAFFLLWVFVARTRGPFTVNRGGRIES